MEKTVAMALLFDFYGELLTERQREYFDLYYNDNLSLSEIAANSGTSRQAVRDIIMRAEAILEDTEAKVECIARHDRLLEQISRAEEYLDRLTQLCPQGAELCGKVYGLLQDMKL